MAYVRIGPYPALRLTAAFRGSPIDAYLLSPIERLHYECPRAPADEDRHPFAQCTAPLAVRAPVYYDFARVVAALCKEDGANADGYNDKALLARAETDSTSIACGQHIYVSSALLKELILSAAPQSHAPSSLMSFLRREFQNRADSAAFGTARPSVFMEMFVASLASPERSLDAAPQDPPQPPSPRPAEAAPPARKRGRYNKANKTPASESAADEPAPAAPTPALAPTACAPPSYVGDVTFGGGGTEQTIRMHMYWISQQVAGKHISEELATLFVDRYVYYVSHDGRTPPPESSEPGSRKRKAAEADLKPVQKTQ